MKHSSEDGTEQQIDLGGLAYEPIVHAAATAVDAPSPVADAQRVAAGSLSVASNTQGIAIGEPMVLPLRRPERTTTSSCSILIRPPRPYPPCRRVSSALI